MKKIITIGVLTLLLTFFLYSFIGTFENVDEIKRRAPQEMASRGWVILRYEGFQYGSWDLHGGTVWYHVANVNDLNTQYRVQVALWNDEFQFYYGAPEQLVRISR